MTVRGAFSKVALGRLVVFLARELAGRGSSTFHRSNHVNGT